MRFIRWSGFPIVLVLLASGCDWHGHGAKAAEGAPAPEAGAVASARGGPVQAPKALVYPVDTVTAVKGAPLELAAPVSVGDAATSFSIKPALPEGLVFDPRTGVLSGTPKKVAARASYEVTAANAGGSTTVSLTLAVNDQAPAGTPEVSLPQVVTAGATGRVASTKDLGEGTTYAWVIDGGTITAGQGTASVTFTAGEEGALSAQVKVSNSGGTVLGRAEGMVVPRPEASLNVPLKVRPGADWMTATVLAKPGMTFEWTLVPGSSDGHIVSGQGTSTITFGANPALGTFQIQVKVTNKAGDSATATGTVEVVPVS